MPIQIIGSGTLSGVNGIRFDTFPTSRSINTMTAYEEGTWTGFLRLNSTSSGTTEDAYTHTLTSNGRYIKCGKSCFVENYFDVSYFYNYVAYRVENLPFLSGTGTNGNGYPLSIGHQRGIRFVYGGSIITSAQQAAVVQPSSTTVRLYASSMASAFTGWYYIDNAYSANSRFIHFSGVYETAA